MKIKISVAREIQYFEIGIFSFNSYVYYLTRGFIASTRAFNLPTRAFNLATRAFNLATRAFSVLTCGFELVTRGFELVTLELELVTCNWCFTFPPKFWTILEKILFQFLNLIKTFISEAHSELCQTCKMERFMKMLND